MKPHLGIAASFFLRKLFRSLEGFKRSMFLMARGYCDPQLTGFSILERYFIMNCELMALGLKSE
jgi:hypothetical protein